MSGPALVRWGSASAWFSDARDADALADVLRRGTDTVTVETVKFEPGEVDEAIERRDELEEACDRAINVLEIGSPDSIQAALDALEGVKR